MRFITFALIICSLSLQAQDSKLGKLWSKWSNTQNSDSIRLSAISDYIWDGYLFIKPDSAMILADLEYQLATEKKNTRYQSDALNIKGIANAVTGRYDEALVYFEENFNLAVEIENKSLEAKMANNIANIYRDRGDFTKSDLYFGKAQKIFEQVNDSLGLSKAYNNLGISKMIQGNFAQAFEFFERSKIISESISNDRERTAAYNNLGNLNKNQGNLEQALYYYDKSFALANKNNDIAGQSSSIVNIGGIHKENGDYDTAIVWYRQSLALKEKIKNIQSISTVYTKLGAVYNKKKAYDSALIYFKKGLEIEEDLKNDEGIALALANIGACHHYKGSVLKTTDPDIAQVHFALAEDYCFKALAIANRIALQTTYATLFKLNYDKQKWEESFNYLNDITHHRDKALKYNFFTLSERDKEIYFSTMADDYEIMYDFALQHQTQFPSAVDTVFNYVLKNKAITLKSSTAMRQQILNSGDTALIADYKTWIALKKQIAQGVFAATEMDSVLQEARKQEQALNRNSKEFKSFESLEKLQWKDVQSHLKKDEAAVEFIHFDSYLTGDTITLYTALIITSTMEHPQYVQLCTEDELTTFLQSAAGDNLSMVKKLYGTKGKLNEELYKMVWQPMEKHLESIKTIYLSPSGLLHKISFSALAKDKDTYLCDHYQLNSLGSTSQLIDYASNANIFEEKTYLIGGVIYNSDSTHNKVWSYLPNTLTESQTIYDQLNKKGYPSAHITGTAASEAAVKDICTHAGILHLSSHGFFFADPKAFKEENKSNEFYQGELAFRGVSQEEIKKLTASNVYAQWNFIDNQNPLMRSGIVLSGGNDIWQRSALTEGEDGILTAAEVANLDMRNTNLVVLSACESGLGDIKGSEGVYGLQRSFKMAGVKYLITSLWQVPDKETAEFMTLFYKNLSKSKDIKNAFLKAQQVMRKKYDPFYWSAFVLME